MRKKIFYRIQLFILAAAALAFAVLIIWLSFGLADAREATSRERLESVRQSVTNGVTLCYSIEGFYPDSLEYLKENYGVSYDSGRYLVHYRYIAADIKPTILVSETGALDQ